MFLSINLCTAEHCYEGSRQLKTYIEHSASFSINQFTYLADDTQVAFLRLLSKRVKQTITYKCLNSRAWDETGKKSIALIGNDLQKITMTSSKYYKPKVLINDCNVSEWLIAVIYKVYDQLK